MEPKCLYCGNALKYACTTIDNIGDWNICKNHPLKVWLFAINHEITFVELKNNEYILRIDLKVNEMWLSTYDDYFRNNILKLPLDNSLTPENFNDKLKLYLTFQ